MAGLVRWTEQLCTIARVGVLCALTTLFSACGGGGGGSGNSQGSDSKDGVRVFHAAVDAAPVDVVSSELSERVVSQQFFAGTQGYRALAEGPQVLSLTRAFNPSDVLASFRIDIKRGAGYSLLLYGDIQTFGLRSRIIEDTPPERIEGAVIRVVNGVTGASALNISISSTDDTIIGFGQNSEYKEVGVGTVAVSARRSADGLELARVSVSAEPQRAYSILFAGEAAFYAKGVVFVDR